MDDDENFNPVITLISRPSGIISFFSSPCSDLCNPLISSRISRKHENIALPRTLTLSVFGSRHSPSRLNKPVSVSPDCVSDVEYRSWTPEVLRLCDAGPI